MAAIAGDLTKTILGQTDAAKAFRPWWDSMKDGLMYAMVVMGVVTLPMTFITGTPLDCTIHPALWSIGSSINYSYTAFDFPVAAIPAHEMPRYARFLRSYSKKYCTEMHVSPFLLYFPFALFLVPITMVFTEKLFIKAYNSDVKMEQLWSMLLKSSLEREDVATLEQENIKNNHEIQQAFRNSCDVHDSYLVRTVLELVCGVALAAFFCIFSSIDGIASALFDCDVHGIPFKCIIPNSRFFYVCYMLSLIIIFVYTACCTYNLVWLLHPRVGRLERVLSGMVRKRSSMADSLDLSNSVWVRASRGRLGRKRRYGEDAPEVRLDMYYDKKGKDFRLLMCLLSETSGLAHTFRILTVFDKHFQRQWRARDIKVIVDDDHHHSAVKAMGFNAVQQQQLQQQQQQWGGGHGGPRKDQFRSLWVFWNDASIASYMSKANRKSLFEYTVEITPCTEAPVKSFLYHGVPDFTAVSADKAGSDSTKEDGLSTAPSSSSPPETPFGSRNGSRRFESQSSEKTLLMRNNSLSFYSLNMGGSKPSAQWAEMQRKGNSNNSSFSSAHGASFRRKPSVASASNPASPSSPMGRGVRFPPSLPSVQPVASLSSETMDTTYKYSTRFDGLQHGVEYTVSLSTEVDGKTITQVNILAIRGGGDDDCSGEGGAYERGGARGGRGGDGRDDNGKL